MAKRDRPVEIEITPQAIEAGRRVLAESGRLWSDRQSGDALLVAEMFRAIRRVQLAEGAR